MRVKFSSPELKEFQKTGQLSLQERLGARFNPQWTYQMTFPSLFAAKQAQGWQLICENADEILGQTLIIVGKPKENDQNAST